MQTSPAGPIYWLGNIYTGNFENIFIKNVLVIFSLQSGTKVPLKKLPKNLSPV